MAMQGRSNTAWLAMLQDTEEIEKKALLQEEKNLQQLPTGKIIWKRLVQEKQIYKGLLQEKM